MGHELARSGLYAVIPDCALATHDTVLTGFVRSIPWGFGKYRAEFQARRNMRVTHIALRYTEDGPYKFYPLGDIFDVKKDDIMNAKFTM